ncbi:MAG TPA: hypothetical protein VFO76_00955 [Candidatus Kapabacteria bacterium]|nr:hypothetical protein [Candidatus Kapabacteria bacterium]
MKRLLVYLFLMGSVVSIGCSNSADGSDSGSTAITGKQLLPLKVGNVWTYHNQEWNDDGSVNEDDVKQITILRDTTFDGHPAFYSIAFDKPAVFYYVGNDLYNQSYDAFQIPQKLGEEVIVDDTSSASSTRNSILLRSSNIPVTVPAGNFNCVQIDALRFFKNASGQLDSNSIDSKYYAQNIGMIKEELVVFPQGHRHTFRILQLTNYELK